MNNIRQVEIELLVTSWATSLWNRLRLKIMAPQCSSFQTPWSYRARHNGERHGLTLCQDCLLETFIDLEGQRCSQDLPSADDSGLVDLGDYCEVQRVRVASPRALSSGGFDEMMRLFNPQAIGCVLNSRQCANSFNWKNKPSDVRRYSELGKRIAPNHV